MGGLVGGAGRRIVGVRNPSMEYTWFILLLVVSGTVLMLLLLHGTGLGALLHDRIPDRPRRRLFVATVSFFLTFGGVRGVVYCITHQIPPFHFVIMQGRHVHHLVFGIIILLAVGYAWLAEIGVGAGASSLLASRLLAILVWSGSGAHARRIRAVAEPARRVLVSRRPRQYRCGGAVRSAAGGRRVGRAAVFTGEAEEGFVEVRTVDPRLAPKERARTWATITPQSLGCADSPIV